ncbi:MAG: 2-dehydro-3-deoxy-D-gluconate 5-dehydrogenase KduD [Gemmatimonadaceae bacterium]
MEMFSLAGKRALVTGASRGIGRAAAVALAEAGADVVCAASSVDGVAETVSALKRLGRKAWAVGADLSVRDAALALADAAEQHAGQIDILINNAGTIRRAPAIEHSMDDWELVIRTNLDAAWQLSQRIGRGMVARGHGKIVNVASLLSFSGGITVPGYTASKHAIAGLTKALANEWAASGVNVNAIAPGYFETDNTQRLRDDAKRFADISARIPAGRWGKTTDLAGAFVFLSSSASDYVNGHVLTVDGGWMAR